MPFSKNVVRTALSCLYFAAAQRDGDNDVEPIDGSRSKTALALDNNDDDDDTDDGDDVEEEESDVRGANDDESALTMSAGVWGDLLRLTCVLCRRSRRQNVY